MAKKKTTTRPRAHDVEPASATVEDLAVIVETQDAPVEIECPQHSGNMLQVKKEGPRLYAICNCVTRWNPWKGQVVWERTLGPEAAQNKSEEE